MKLLEQMLKTSERTAKGFFLASVAAIAGLFLIILLDVLIRLVIGISLEGEVEISEYLLVAVGFLGLGYAQLGRGHVNIDFLTMRLSVRLNAIMDIIVLAISALFSAAMAWQIGKEAWVAWVDKIYRSGTSVLTPTWPPNLMACLGCIMLSLCFLTQIVRNIVLLVARKQKGFKT